MIYIVDFNNRELIEVLSYDDYETYRYEQQKRFVYAIFGQPR